MALTPVQVQTIAQELPSGYAVNIDTLFSTTNAEGLPITEYMFRTGGGTYLSLNGAANLATAAQSAEGEVVISAADLAKVTIEASSLYTSGVSDITISAFDGVTWSNPTGEALTFTANATAISPVPGVVMQAGSSIAATRLFSVSGYLNLNSAQTSYTLDPAPGSGVIEGNGAYNLGAGSFPGAFEVRGTELNLLTYQAPTTPGYYHFVINVLPGYSGQPWSDWAQVNITVTGPATSAAVEIQNAAAGKPLYAAYVSDSAANVQADLDALQGNLSAGILLGITLTDQSPAMSVSAQQFLADRGVLALIASGQPYALTVTDMDVVQAAALAGPGGLGFLAPLDLADSAADLVANLDALNLQIAKGLRIASITLTDAGDPTLHLTFQQALDSSTLSLVSGNYAIVTDGVAAADVALLKAVPHMASIGVSDSALNVGHHLSDLDAAAQAGLLSGVTLTDGGVPTITIQTGTGNDLPALDAISSPFVLAQQVEGGSWTVTALAGHGNVAIFSGAASAYTMASGGAGDIVVSTVNANEGYVDHLDGMDAVVFSDATAIIAPAPSASAPTSGNIAALYAAVLDRVPDVAGFAYYKGLMAANPSLPLTSFAAWFLQSPEYTAAHNYAQTAAGDAQFITDTYQNLLHRAPGAGDVAWYQINVLAPILAGAAPGTTAYGTAELQAHAQLLVDFSASGEFLADVQITATHPADAQHWLFVS